MLSDVVATAPAVSVVVTIVSELVVAYVIDSVSETEDASEADAVVASNTLVVFEVSATSVDAGMRLHAISCRLNRTHNITPQYLNVLRILLISLR